MGICITCEGQLQNSSLIEQFTKDMKYIADKLGWGTKTPQELAKSVFDKEVELSGISLYPQNKCDPVHLHLYESGRLTNIIWYIVKYKKPKEDFEQMKKDCVMIGISRDSEP